MSHLLRRQRYSAARLLARSARRVKPRPDPESRWFWEHYDVAVEEIIDFCEGELDLQLQGADIADIGCGDGIMALGVCKRVRPRTLIGFDPILTNREILLSRSRSEQVADHLPAELIFKQSTDTTIPAESDMFDFVYSWSAFEHIAQPAVILKEIHRVLRPEGGLFLQLWPFYRSAKGSHLWDWFPDDFHHLLEDREDILVKLEASDRHSPEWTAYMIREFKELNRVSLVELQQAVRSAGFTVRKLELISAPTRYPPGLPDYSWSDLCISGIKLLATPDP